MISKDAKSRAEGLVRSIVLRARHLSKQAVRARIAHRMECNQPQVYFNKGKAQAVLTDWQSFRERRKGLMQCARDVKESYELPAWLCGRGGVA